MQQLTDSSDVTHTRRHTNGSLYDYVAVTSVGYTRRLGALSATDAANPSLTGACAHIILLTPSKTADMCTSIIVQKHHDCCCSLAIKAKFHYAIWFEAGSRLVRSRSPTSFEPDSVMEFDFEPVCDQLRTSFEAASIMEFGFNPLTNSYLR